MAFEQTGLQDFIFEAYSMTHNVNDTILPYG